MKQIHSIILLSLIAQQSMALSVVKTYPYLNLNEAQVNSIIEQAVLLGIDKTVIIDSFEAYSYNLDGELAGVSLKFKPSEINSVLQEQHNLHCKPQNKDFSQFSCNKSTYKYLKLDNEDQAWIQFKNPYNFSYDELVEVITYANKAKPVSWQGEVTYVSAEANYIFQACYDYKPNPLYSKGKCLNIKRTRKNDANYFSVDWMALNKYSSG